MSNYEQRAVKFAAILARYFHDCETLDEYIDAIEFYNAVHTNKLNYDFGVSRIAIIRSDYVIKIAYLTDDEEWQDKHAGTNQTEADVYEQACKDGFEYLLAKTTLMKINGREFAIMPRVRYINDYKRDYEDYLTYAERKWIYNHVYDIHRGNVGYKNHKPVIIDYAWSTAL